jgi:integrase
MNVIGRLSKEKTGNREIFIAISTGNIKARTGSGIFCTVENDNDGNSGAPSWFNYVKGECKSPFENKRKKTPEQQKTENFNEKAHKDYNDLTKFINEKIVGIDKSGISSQWLKQCVDEFRKRGIFKQKTLLEHITEFIEKYYETVGTKTGRKLSEKNINEYIILKKRLQEFAAVSNKKDFEINEVNEMFIADFEIFLTDSKNYMVNTIGNYLKCFRAVLNKYNLYNPKNKITVPKITVMKEETFNTYLTDSELEKIWLLDLSKSVLNKARNTLLLLSYTASRLSDVQKLIDPQNIKDRKITYYQQKTGVQVVVPFIYHTEEVIAKCRTEGMIVNKRLNGYIKKICELAGINETVTKQYTKGGKRIVKHIPKYELITSHSGRRSCCTNYKNIGIDPLSIMKISGHKQLATLQKYICTSNEENADLILEMIRKNKIG